MRREGGGGIIKGEVLRVFVFAMIRKEEEKVFGGGGGGENACYVYLSERSGW